MKNLKTILLSIVLITFGYSASAQVPKSFNYMAIARDGYGDLIQNTGITVRIAILDQPGLVVWEEEHAVTTNDNGLFQLVVGDPAATKIPGGYDAMTFADIDWTPQPLYIRTKLSLVPGVWLDMGNAQLVSVPYAMISESAYNVINNPVTMNNDTVVIMNSVDVVGDYATTEDEALFEVKRQDGQTMFGVYNQGVRINIPMVDNVPKGAKGGFSIGGFGTSKGGYLQELFTLNKDSARIYLDKTPDLAKGAKGGFAIGGFALTGKENWPVQNYLFIAPDSARIYVDNSGKAAKGGFAIGGFGSSKGPSTNFMDITPNNYFIGHGTGTKAIVGDALYNSVIGFQAARALTTGDYNTILGYKADSSLTSGNNNIIIGATAGFKLTTGQHNTLIGSGAGFNHTSHQYNIMIGTGAGYNLTGSFNNFIGINAGNKIRPGTDNLLVGTNAGAMLEEGTGNTIIGIDAGRGGDWDPETYHDDFVTSNNTIIGNGAGYSLDVGSGNVFIGYYAGAGEIGTALAPADNKLYISNSWGSALIYGDFSSGRIGLGTITPAYKLDVVGDINITGDFRVNGSPLSTATLTTGNLTATGPVSVSPTQKVVGGAAVISIADASTSAKGAVQLSNHYDGPSVTLATTEKALTDGLATKVTGTGMTMGTINMTASGNVISTYGMVLIWNLSTPRFSIYNGSDVDCWYWYSEQGKGSAPTGNAMRIDIGATDPIVLTVKDGAGYEIHFGDVEGTGGYCSLWLHFAGGVLTGHYIKN